MVLKHLDHSVGVPGHGEPTAPVCSLIRAETSTKPLISLF